MPIIIKRTDGGVSIMQQLPIALRRKSDRKRFEVTRVMSKDGGVTLTFCARAADPIEEDGQSIFEEVAVSLPVSALESERGLMGWSLIFRSIEEEVEAWKAGAPGEYVSHRSMPQSAIPSDRTFRAAWSDTTRKLVIDHDMDKARGIWRDKMRAARAPKLSELDLQVQRGMEAGADLKPIFEAKKALRDVTVHPDIEAAKTPDELKAIWPEILG